MDQSVVYADLKFAVAPTCPTAPDEDDSPYENMPLGTVAPAPSPGNWPRRWRVPAGLLAASLLLLLVATIALGTCYWQVTRRLQDTSREHTAEQDRLSQEVSAREQSLEQTRLELAWARAELQQAWQEGNSSQLELESLNAELQYTRQEMDVLQKEMQEVQVKLNDSENTVSSLRACVNTAFCAGEWCQVLDWRVSIKIALVNLRDPMRIHMQSKLFHPGYLHCSHLHPSQAEVLGTA
ncbi:uncharacterized protein LOC102094185 isoform X5 [Columba livia]|uniref:uncharacterized protein LOC102094185 isoform X5 n=1 Tax=Columba livia TaxID=8932 RepID=UPI0031B9F673